MDELIEQLKSERFVKPKGTSAFINKNLDKLYAIFNEMVVRDGALNLKLVGDSILSIYGIYDGGEVRSYLYRVADNSSSNYSLNCTTLTQALTNAYQIKDNIMIVNGLSLDGAGRGRIDLTRFLYSEESKLTDFMKTNSSLEGKSKNKQVINVENMFR